MSVNKISLKSMRLILVFPAVVVVISTGLVVGSISYRTAQHSVDVVAEQLRAEKLNRVIDHLKSFFAIPQRILKDNAMLLQSGDLDAENIDHLTRYFLRQNMNFGVFNSIYFANTSGGLAVGGIDTVDNAPIHDKTLQCF